MRGTFVASLPVPVTIPLDKIIPFDHSDQVLLMGAGPVPIPKEVAVANGIVISHLGEAMKQVMKRIQLMSQYVMQTKTEKIFGIAGPGSAAMEMAVAALCGPQKKVLILNMGTFSTRFAEIARGVGADVTDLFPDKDAGDFAFRAEKIKAVFEKNKFDVICMVQGETSCGVKNIELKEIVQLAKKYNVTTIVDSVSTLSTMELPMDEWGIDVLFTAGQKGLSSIPGVSLIAFSEQIFAKIAENKNLSTHWCLDPRRAYKFWALGEYHYTAPVPGLLALHEALRLVCEETLEKRFERHLNSSLSLQAGLEKLGLELYTPKEWRLNSVIAIKTPKNIVSKELISYLIKQHKVEIAGAFGLDIIRVGQMGEQCRPENVQKVLTALEYSLKHF